ADLLHTAEQVVRVGNHEAAGAVRQQVHDLLIVGSAGWEPRNVHARRIVVEGIVRIVGIVGIVDIVRPAGVGVGAGSGVAGAARACVAGSAARGAAPRPRVASTGTA